MPRRVLMQRNGETFDLVEVPAPNEHHLQEIMKGQPQLIPSDDLGLDGDLLVVGRETALASGYIDLLCLARSGDVVLIEFKTGPQNPDFRHALAQLIDYGSDLWRLGIDDFDRGVVQRYLSGAHCAAEFRGAQTLVDAISRTNWDLTAEEIDGLLGRLGDVLATGDFHYVVSAQRFTPSMRTSLDYMNATMRFGRFYLVEIVQLEGAELTAHAAQVVAAPPKRGSSTAPGEVGQADEAAFLAAVDEPAYRDAIRDILATCGTLGMEVKWRSVGASIRIQTTDRKQPLSVGWLLPAGTHWQGARDFAFGVDLSSLEGTPSVREAVLTYTQQMSEVPGAKAVPSKLNAFTFGPDALPRAATDIVAVLEQLTTDVAGTE